LAWSTAVIKETTMLYDLYLYCGIYGFALAILGVVIIAITLERTYSLFLKKDHSRDNLERRLGTLRFLALASPLVGLIGSLLQLAHSLEESAPMPPDVLQKMIPIMIGVGVHPLAFGLILALAALTSHFIFAAKTGRIREMLMG
jgi:biopolymer transport protein ExbB/TolQ